MSVGAGSRTGALTGPSRSGRGRGASGVELRHTWINWLQANLEKAKVVTPKEGETVEQLTDEQRMRKAFQIPEWDDRPTLLYFHYPHETEEQAATESGLAAKKQCKELDDEDAARWSTLVHCVEVDMSSSHRKLLEKYGAGDAPSFALLTHELTIVATTPATDTKGFVKFLKSSLPQVKEYWEHVQDRIDRQKDKIAEAKKLAKKDREKALVRYREVLDDGVRIVKTWDTAASEVARLEQQIQR